MACVHPIPAWRTPGGLTLREPHDHPGEAEYLRLPCGTCVGCRLSRAREWALRCGLELSSHDTTCWTTLTYDDAHVPPTLEKRHLSAFVKRLRARMGGGLRFFGSGEYGERTQRPHYHAILFGVPECAPVQACWPHGFARVDPVSPAAIAYVAGYCSKKVGWKLECSERVDYGTGEMYTWQPPFVLMSRRPGIGGAMRKHWRSWRRFAIHDGVEVPVPRYLHAAWQERATEAERLALKQEKAAQPRAEVSRRSLAADEVIAIARQAISSSRRVKV